MEKVSVAYERAYLAQEATSGRILISLYSLMNVLLHDPSPLPPLLALMSVSKAQHAISAGNLGLTTYLDLQRVTAPSNATTLCRLGRQLVGTRAVI